MIEIEFSGKTLFKFKDSNLIQLVGLNEELKKLIVDIYVKILNGYKFTDDDMGAMKGFYPLVKKDEQNLKKNDITVIKISQIEDLIDELQVKNGSILLKYLISLSDEMDICKGLINIEESMIELTIIIDKLMEEKILTEDILIKTEVSNMDFKKIITTFIETGFFNKLQAKQPLWLMENKNLIDLFLETIRLVIERNEDITIIVDGLDIRLELDVYNYFIDKLYNLVENYSNFKIWLIPRTVEGILIDYHIFNNTYVLNKEIILMGDFDIAYESICRNYPSNNIPTEEEVLESLLELFSFHSKDKYYSLSRKTVILGIFLKLLDEEGIKLMESSLTTLETNFLTSNKR